MAVHFNLDTILKNENNPKAKLHLMPCIIKNDGEAKVSAYFEPIISRGNDALQSSFRGYPLMGKEINVPKNYTGIVMQETLDKLNETSERNIYGVHMFDKFTYWNWDVEPSGNDKVQMAFDWFDIAEALHSPIDS